MTNKYLVEPIKGPKTACWPTSMLMLDKWRRMRFGWSLLSYPSDLESVVYSHTKHSFLFNRANIPSFLKKYGFTSRKILATPEAFAKLLAEGRPFAYIALSEIRGYEHALVITGIQKGHQQLYTIYYIDPDPDSKGGTLRDEFYAFMVQHPPAWGNDAFVVVPSN